MGRETSKTIELGHFIKTDTWKLDSNIFYRWDNDLTDWTYFSGDVNRTANPVDTKTFGFELVASREMGEISKPLLVIPTLRKKRITKNLTLWAAFMPSITLRID